MFTYILNKGTPGRIKACLEVQKCKIQANYILIYMKVKVLVIQLCPTLYNPRWL